MVHEDLEANTNQNNPSKNVDADVISWRTFQSFGRKPGRASNPRHSANYQSPAFVEALRLGKTVPRHDKTGMPPEKENNNPEMVRISNIFGIEKQGSDGLSVGQRSRDLP